MKRYLAFILATLAATFPVASACTATSSDWVGFTIDKGSEADRIRISFRDHDRARHGGDNRWTSTLAARELAGLDLNALRASGSRPLRFELVRDAGRLDCSGEGGNHRAQGNCAFTPNSGFLALLASRGIRSPSRDEQFAMMAVDVRPQLLNSLAAAKYPTPDVDELISAAAVGVTGDYISELARLGYRPRSLDTLVEFRALDITPAFIASFASLGYGNLDAQELVELKALDITPEYIRGFEQLGYRNLPVDKLVELKALDITPEFVRAVAQRPGELPPIEQLAVLQSLQRRR